MELIMFVSNNFISYPLFHYYSYFNTTIEAKYFEQDEGIESMETTIMSSVDRM